MNIELAEKVLQKIVEHPEQHNQETVVDGPNECGTTACVAGWAMLLSGEWRTKLVTPESFPPFVTFERADGGDEAEDWEESEDWEVAARRLLGLEDYRATELFFTMDEDQAVERLRSMIDEAKEEGQA